MAETELESLKKDVAALSQLVDELRAELSAHGGVFLSESSNTTQHIKVFHNQIRYYLMPLVNKVLPGYEATRKQIDSFLQRHNGPKDPTKIS